MTLQNIGGCADRYVLEIQWLVHGYTRGSSTNKDIFFRVGKHLPNLRNEGDLLISCYTPRSSPCVRRDILASLSKSILVTHALPSHLVFFYTGNLLYPYGRNLLLIVISLCLEARQ